MPYNYSFSSEFKKAFGKLDNRMKFLVKKKIAKIAENPELGKPLHKPLQNFKSERVEKMRIVYAFDGKSIEFALLDDRGHVYD